MTEIRYLTKHFSSPNYPGNYYNSADCTKVFHSSSDGLTFQFIDFITESCCDHVTFSDSNGDILETANVCFLL